MVARVRRQGISLVIGLVVALLVMIGCGSSPAMQKQRQERSSKRERPVSWHLARAPEGRVIHIFNSTGWCSGAPRPYIARVKTRETRTRVVLTLILANPPRKKGVCAGVGFGVVRAVRLRSPLGRRVLFDGSQSPPMRRWPHSPRH